MTSFPAHGAIELESLGSSYRNDTFETKSSPCLSTERRSATVRRSGSKASDGVTREVAPTTQPLHIQPSWNNPKVNMFRLPVLFFDFIVFGMNDGSYGALLPALESYYGLSYTIVSLIFLTPFAGYTVAAFASSPLHFWVGQRGVAFVAPACRIITYVVIACHPPYPAIVAILVIAGFGNGLADAAWNAYLGDIKSTNEVLGIMHACYGLGATISPLIITAMINTYGLPWWTFYYIMISASTLDMVLGTSAFWIESAKEFRRKNSGGEGEDRGRTRQAVKSKITWIIAAFLLFYVGTEVSLGGWIITFMTQVRHAAAFPSGLTATGFWLGITVGRITLGFVTGRVGERVAVSIYLVLAVALQLVFWLVPSFVVSAVIVALQGLALAPLFPSAIVAASRLLPKKLHVSAIGISAAVGGGGAALLPFATGAIVNAKGVSTLQPIILAFLVCQLGLWLLLPKFPQNTRED